MFKNSSQVEIISGIDEGTNAWISVNYFLNNFKPVIFTKLLHLNIDSL